MDEAHTAALPIPPNVPPITYPAYPPLPDVCLAAVRIWERTQMVRVGQTEEQLTYTRTAGHLGRTSQDLAMDIDSDIDILC